MRAGGKWSQAAHLSRVWPCPHSGRGDRADGYAVPLITYHKRGGVETKTVGLTMKNYVKKKDKRRKKKPYSTPELTSIGDIKTNTLGVSAGGNDYLLRHYVSGGWG